MKSVLDRSFAMIKKHGSAGIGSIKTTKVDPLIFDMTEKSELPPSLLSELTGREIVAKQRSRPQSVLYTKNQLQEKDQLFASLEFTFLFSKIIPPKALLGSLL